MSKIDQTKEVIVSISQKTDEAILFFSTGKDSIVLLDLIAPYFKRIVCVYMYFVKDLEHINKYLRWAKSKYLNIELIQVPHWNLTYILRNGTFCAPHPKVKILKLADVVRSVQLSTGIDYVFLGMKKADSLNRRLMMMRDGAIIGEKVYPLMDWTNKEVIKYLKAKKLPEPIRYSSKPSGGVVFDIDCYLYLQKYYPDDLKKILIAFPLSEKILIDYEKQKETKK